MSEVPYHVYSVCNETLDIALMVDRSGSISVSDYEDLKDFVQELIEHFEVGPNKVRFAAVLYNATVDVEFYLFTHTTESAYVSHVQSFPGPGGTTNIAGALERTTDDVLQLGTGDRDNVPNVCLLITDGMANVRETETESEAARLRQKCTLFTVGIGNNIDQPQLERIATGGASGFLHADDIADLQTILGNLTELLCNGSKYYSSHTISTNIDDKVMSINAFAWN
jgi:uncharacterized protein YegL